MDFGGQPYSRMLTGYVCLAISVRSQETHPKRMKCLNNLCCSVKYLMYGALTLWDHFPTLVGICIFC
ncbi:hypothetical protein AHAS_Ahas20G0189300 [Arachis hypogaea]